MIKLTSGKTIKTLPLRNSIPRGNLLCLSHIYSLTYGTLLGIISNAQPPSPFFLRDRHTCIRHVIIGIVDLSECFPSTVVIIENVNSRIHEAATAPKDRELIGGGLEFDTFVFAEFGARTGEGFGTFAIIGVHGRAADPWVVPAGFKMILVGGGGAVGVHGEGAGAEGEKKKGDDLHRWKRFYWKGDK